MRSTPTARVAPLILAVCLAVATLPHPALAVMAAHRDGTVALARRAASHVALRDHDQYHSRLSRPHHASFSLRLAEPRVGRLHPSHPRLSQSRPPRPRLAHAQVGRRHVSHQHLNRRRVSQAHLPRSRAYGLRLNEPRLGRAHGRYLRLRHTRASHPHINPAHRDINHPRLSTHPVTATPALPYMASRVELLALINAERTQAGVRPLTFDPILNIVAQWRSQDMISRHYFSHQIPPGGHYVFDTLDRDHVLYEMAGENIALNNYIDFYSLDRTVRQTNTDLMNSPDHRANILEPKYTEIGLGMAFDHGTGKLIVTEVFVQP